MTWFSSGHLISLRCSANSRCHSHSIGRFPKAISPLSVQAFTHEGSLASNGLLYFAYPMTSLSFLKVQIQCKLFGETCPETLPGIIKCLLLLWRRHTRLVTVFSDGGCHSTPPACTPRALDRALCPGPYCSVGCPAPSGCSLETSGTFQGLPGRHCPSRILPFPSPDTTVLHALSFEVDIGCGWHFSSVHMTTTQNCNM